MTSFLPKYIGKFEGVSIYESQRLGYGMHSGGIALPGYGIVVGLGTFSLKQGMPVVRHEFGHFLQARQMGVIRFYLFVGIPSLLSAWLKWHGKRHQEFWTEAWCNRLAADYFKGDTDWPYHHFPAKDISNKSKRWLVYRRYR